MAEVRALGTGQKPEDAVAWLRAELARRPARGVFVAIDRNDASLNGDGLSYRLCGQMGGIAAAWFGALLVKWGVEDEGR